MKNTILTCNHDLVQYLVSQNKLPQQYLAEDSEKVFKLYQSSFKSTKFLVDRSGKTPHYLNIDFSKYRIPQLKPISLDFLRIARERAKSLLDLGKVINVSWSGGLDSTFVLFILHELAVDKDQVKVYGTYSSILESGIFFEKYIRPNFKCDIHVNKTYKNNFITTEDEIFVTGSMGNNIFYQDLNYHQPDSWIHFKEDGFKPDLIKKYAGAPYERVISELNLEFLQNSIKGSPRKIETLQDLRWWIQFAFNWHTTISNTSIQVGKERSQKIHAFFASDEFQLWSILNKDIPSKVGDYSDERWQLREYIAEYTKDPFYAKNKTNQTSVISSVEPNWLFLLNDYSNIYLEDLQ
jgi:hypothetical protein